MSRERIGRPSNHCQVQQAEQSSVPKSIGPSRDHVLVQYSTCSVFGAGNPEKSFVRYLWPDYRHES